MNPIICISLMKPLFYIHLYVLIDGPNHFLIYTYTKLNTANIWWLILCTTLAEDILPTLIEQSA